MDRRSVGDRGVPRDERVEDPADTIRDEPEDAPAGLPPRPDPMTGRPRPPEAPGPFGRALPIDRIIDDRAVRHPPPSPPGQGPVLSAFRENARFAAVVLGLAMFGILWLRNGNNLLGLRMWPVWLVILAFTGIIYLRLRRQRGSAGAVWVARGRRWVRTYELVRITCRGRSLRLEDSGGRVLWYPLANSGRGDRLLWDLTYNGIRHSVAAGAAIDRSARAALALPGDRPAGETPPGGTDRPPDHRAR